ncbi:MAG TPA: hypothetical protein PK830_04925 [Candidatus Atribacteria bacterium]|nr:hypothetical protein [Candidatus Atribacteria bacterium]HPT78426.1 hypothetical protein [Candidatus Atribacteria bacterium]
MIRTFIQLITLSFLAVGAIVCGIGYRKHYCYKGGLFFFIFSLLANIASLISSYAGNIYIQRNITRIGTERLGIMLQLFDLPAFVLSTIGMILFLLYLVKGLNQQKQSD